MSNALLLGGILGVCLVVVVLYLYAQKKMKEGSMLFWLVASLAIVLLSWTPLILILNVVIQASNVTNIALAGFIFILIMAGVYLTVRVSELTEEVRKLTFAVALKDVRVPPDHVKGSAPNANERKKNEH